MDQLAVDITNTEGITTRDVATLIDTEGTTRLSADVVAKNSGSISNELLCRMPMVFCVPIPMPHQVPS